MVKASERFFLMGLLQQNVISSRSEVYCKKSVLKNFAKFTWKHPYRSLFLIWDNRYSSAGVLLWILLNFQEHLFRRTSRNGCFWNVYIISLLNIIQSNLRETFQSSVSYSSILSLYLYRNMVYKRARSLWCCISLEKCFMGNFGCASWSWKQKVATEGLNS